MVGHRLAEVGQPEGAPELAGVEAALTGVARCRSGVFEQLEHPVDVLAALRGPDPLSRGAVTERGVRLVEPSVQLVPHRGVLLVRGDDLGVEGHRLAAAQVGERPLHAFPGRELPQPDPPPARRGGANLPGGRQSAGRARRTGDLALAREEPAPTRGPPVPQPPSGQPTSLHFERIVPTPSRRGM